MKKVLIVIAVFVMFAGCGKNQIERDERKVEKALEDGKSLPETNSKKTESEEYVAEGKRFEKSRPVVRKVKPVKKESRYS